MRRRTLAAPLVERRRPEHRPRTVPGLGTVSAPGSATEVEADSVARRAPGQVASAPPGSRLRLDGPSVLPGHGRVLDPGLRSAMESRLGADLARVRVQTGSDGARTAGALGARALSAGPDIAFARGTYEPGSHSGRGLIAHELAHTLQPAGTGPAVRRQPAGPVTAGTTASVVELQGHRTFDPPAPIAERIKANGTSPTWVSVRFGDIASGEIPVFWGPKTISLTLGDGYQTPEPKPFMPAWGITLHHPAFRTLSLARPTLWVDLRDSVVSGGMGWVTPVGLATHVSRFKQAVPLEELFGGLQDFTDLRLTGEIVNTLWDGHFRYSAARIAFRSGVFEGSGTLTVRDAAYDLDAGLAVPLAGLPAGADVPVKADQKLGDSPIFLRKRWDYAKSFGPGKGRLSGALSATLGRGHLDIRGTAKYASTSPKVTGTVTVVVGTLPVAQEAVRNKLGAAAPPPDPALTGAGSLAITGWGDLDFALSEWITGRASVIVHPEGYVTAKGELTPTKVVVLTKLHEKEKTLDWLTGDKTIPVAGWGKLAGFNAVVDWKTVAKGSFGPATLHDLRLAGLVSTHPAIANTFELSALISAPATAGLTLTVGARMATHLLTGEAVSAGVKGTGELELLMYAEAGAKAGRRAVAGAAAGAPLGEYFFQGHLDASAALVLRLKLALTGSVLFWEGSTGLVDREWTLGQGGVGLGFTYVLGGKDRDQQLTTEFKKFPFDEDKFGRAMARRDLPEAKQPVRSEATAAAKSDVDRPEAPPEPVLPGTGTKPSAGVGGATTRIDEPFFMGVAQHTLRLELTEHPDVLMSSPRPTSLLWRIKRLRTELRKSPPPAAELQARLEDLAKIEEQAKLVIAAASEAVKNPKYLTPDVPGFHELAGLIEVYAVHYDATDLEATFAAVSVDPADPASILNKFPALAAQSLMVSRVQQILEAGVGAVQLRTIVDKHRPSEETELGELLDLIWTMVIRNVQGWRKVTGDLAIGGNKLKGARFVLQYVESQHGWDSLAFEAEDAEAEDPSGRRWDAWMNGRLYEFKAWYRWLPINDRTFLKQILQDYHRTSGMPLRWVFGPGSMTRGDVLDHMRAALDGVKEDLRAQKELKVPGFTISIADAIAGMLDDIVVKVK